MKYLSFLLALLVCLGFAPVATAASTITVTSPSNGASLTSPFTVTASSKTCGGVPTVSMGYSLDSNPATIEPPSFSATATGSVGGHILHVKCWGKQTHDETLLNITVVPSSADISVISPTAFSALKSPFQLTASTHMCAGVPAVSMGYSLDSNPATIEPTAFTASVAGTAGAHQLHVKCWGSQGAHDELVYGINIASGATVQTPVFSLPSGSYTGKQVISISAPTAGSTIHITIDGSTASASSPVYTGPLTISRSAVTIQAIAVAPGYQNSSLARADYKVISAPPIPDNAIVTRNVQRLGNWRVKFDSGTIGSGSGEMMRVDEPTLDGLTERFVTKYSGWGGVLYSNTYDNDAYATNFVYDARVWISSGTTIANLEMDLNQVMPNGDTVIYGFQCAGTSNTWDYTRNAGTPANPKVEWVRTSSYCNPAQWQKDSWHHVQIWSSRDEAGKVTYHSVWLDGVEYPINATVNSAFSLKWAKGALVVNFQVDDTAASNASSTLY